MRWIVRGDIDGFFGLAIDNLVQLLLIDALCRGVLGFPPELVYGRILPGAEPRYEDRGVYVVCRSSNPGAEDLQHLNPGGAALANSPASAVDVLAA